jgi:hypothetical protein
MCRVWYDGVAPGRQPRPTDCQSAARIAARDRNARVIYGDEGYGGWSGDPRDPRAVPRGSRQPNQFPYPSRDPGGRYFDAAFDTGYRDGYDKGREDARDSDRFDPGRHGRYKSADHGYDKRYGAKDRYKDTYREGFSAGYTQGYRQNRLARW